MAVRAINGLANLCGPTVEEAVNAQAREVGHATNFHLFGLHVLHPTLRLATTFTLPKRNTEACSTCTRESRSARANSTRARTPYVEVDPPFRRES